MKRKKGEFVTLHCARCSWGTEVPMNETEHSTVIRCAHCSELIHWHRCERCGLCYAGGPTPCCPSCDDPSLDDLELV